MADVDKVLYVNPGEAWIYFLHRPPLKLSCGDENVIELLLWFGLYKRVELCDDTMEIPREAKDAA